MNSAEDEEKTARIFSTAARQDIEELKSLLNSPKWYTVENEDGFTLLEWAIVQDNKEVFNFLLSIDDFPLEPASSERKSPLMFSLTEYDEYDEDLNEYYAIELIKKGADVQVVDYAYNTLLHLAVKNEYFEVCPLLIEKGVDVNAENDMYETPLQILLDGVIERGTDDQTILKFLYMLLYYNVDVSPPSKPSLGLEFLEFCLLMDTTDECMQQMLFYYTVDEHSDDCEVDGAVLLYFMSEGKNSSLAYEIMNHINDIKAKRLVDCAVELFLINNNYLKALLDKFDYLINDTLNYCLLYHITDFYFNTESLATFIVFLESEFSDDILKIINYLGISGIIKGYYEYQNCNNSTTTIQELIYYLLPYFDVISSRDLNVVYRKFGYCDLFKVLLHMDIDVDDTLYDIMPGVIFDVHFNLEQYLEENVIHSDESLDESYEDSDSEDSFPGPRPPGRNKKLFYHGCTAEGVEKFLDYFANQTVKDFCCEQSNGKLTVKALLLPQVPLLQELARESCREFIVKRYNVRSCRQFYTILNWLPISTVHKKIISYETPLYCLD